MPAGSAAYPMDFSPSRKAQSYVQRLLAFMQEQVLPAELEVLRANCKTFPIGARWKQPPVMETLKG